MSKYDVTKLNVGIDKLLAVTADPRHRFLLQAYSRHGYLEVAGCYDEIFAPEMMVPNPVYHFHAGGTPVDLVGQESVKKLHHMWAETNQSIFFTENEQVAVAGNFVAFTVTVYEQVWGKALTLGRVASYLPGFVSERIVKEVIATKGIRADENAMYLYTNFIEMI